LFSINIWQPKPTGKNAITFFHEEQNIFTKSFGTRILQRSFIFSNIKILIKGGKNDLNSMNKQIFEDIVGR